MADDQRVKIAYGTYEFVPVPTFSFREVPNGTDAWVNRLSTSQSLTLEGVLLPVFTPRVYEVINHEVPFIWQDYSEGVGADIVGKRVLRGRMTPAYQYSVVYGDLSGDVSIKAQTEDYTNLGVNPHYHHELYVADFDALDSVIWMTGSQSDISSKYSATGISYEVWCKATDYEWSVDTNFETGVDGIFVRERRPVFQYLDGSKGTAFVLSGRNELVPNRWHHLVGSVQSGTHTNRSILLAVDGVIVDSTSGVMNSTNLFQTLGTDLETPIKTNEVTTFSGEIGICRINNKALTVAEIEERYRQERTRFNEDADWNIQALTRVRQEMEDALLVPGKALKVWYNEAEIFALTGAVLQISYPESKHVTFLPYTIEFQGLRSGRYNGISSLEHTWSYSTQQDSQFITVEHTLSAQGVNTNQPNAYNNALDNARAVVQSLTGAAQAPVTLPLTIYTSGTLHKLNITENSDQLAGTFGVTETFFITTGVYKDDWRIVLERGEDYITNVNVDVEIQGLGEMADQLANAQSAISDVSGQIWSKASGAYVTFLGAGAAFNGSFFLLGEKGGNKSIEKNSLNGTIIIRQSFNDSFSLQKSYPNAYVDLFDYTVTEVASARNFSMTNIPWRQDGPIVWDSRSSTRGTITYEGTVRCIAPSGAAEAEGWAKYIINNYLLPDKTDIRLEGAGNFERDLRNRTCSFSITYSFKETAPLTTVL